MDLSIICSSHIKSYSPLHQLEQFKTVFLVVSCKFEQMTHLLRLEHLQQSCLKLLNFFIYHVFVLNEEVRE